MTAVDPFLAARVAELGVPLSADWAPQPLPGYLAAIGQAGSEYEQDLYAAYLQAMAEVGRLQAELAARMEDIAFTDRATLPELRRTIQHHEDGKKRWRDRAEKAEGERARFKAAWQSARFRAQAYSEGILRVVSDREQYQVWLKQAEAKLLKLQYGCETPESHLYGCSCVQAGGVS